MDMYCVSALILAVVLALFGFDEICVKALHELFNKELSTATYYFLFFVIGLLLDILHALKR